MSPSARAACTRSPGPVRSGAGKAVGHASRLLDAGPLRGPAPRGRDDFAEVEHDMPQGVATVGWRRGGRPARGGWSAALGAALKTLP